MLYLDALEVAQVTADDFVFAQPAIVTSDLIGVPEASAFSMGASQLSMEQSLPNLGNLVDAMAAFSPEPGVAALSGGGSAQYIEPTIAVAA